jgi:hypothetical protein
MPFRATAVRPRIRCPCASWSGCCLSVHKALLS